MTSTSLLARLEQEGKVRRQPAAPAQLEALIEAARRNFSAAQKIRGSIAEAAFKLYYDGLLQMGRVVLLSAGYRPCDGDQHKTTFLAAGEILGSEFEDLIRKLQKFRVKRNDCVYEPTGLIGESDVEAIGKTAAVFWTALKAHIGETNPQPDLFERFEE